MKFVELTIKVPLPAPIERAVLALLLLYRRLRYGYPFQRIKLTRGKYAIVDPEDFERFNRYKWHCSQSNYAVRAATIKTEKGRKQVELFMHKVVCPPPQGLIVDHINRNRLDNRRANLRPATWTQNAWNRSKRSRQKTRYKGIRYQKDTKRWQVRLMIEGRRISFGCYNDEKEAAKAYDAAAKKHRGDYAVLNFPQKKPKKRRPH
jgi:hypothetical protein